MNKIMNFLQFLNTYKHYHPKNEFPLSENVRIKIMCTQTFQYMDHFMSCLTNGHEFHASMKFMAVCLLPHLINYYDNLTTITPLSSLTLSDAGHTPILCAACSAAAICSSVGEL